MKTMTMMSNAIWETAIVAPGDAPGERGPENTGLFAPPTLSLQDKHVSRDQEKRKKGNKKHKPTRT